MGTMGHLSSSVDVDQDQDDSHKDHPPRRRRRPHRTNIIQKKLLDIPMAFSRRIRMLILVALGCWFATLAFSHYRLTQVMMENEQDNQQQQQRRRLDLLQQNNPMNLIHPIKSDDDDPTPHDIGYLTLLRRPNTKTLPTLIDPNPPPQSHSHNNNNRPKAPKEYVDHIHPPHKPTTHVTKADLDQHRFLVFQGEKLGGQGAGNLMNGLLAMHLLGEEFGRIVCVIKRFHFLQAFEYKDPVHADLCGLLLEQAETRPEHLIWKDIVQMVNFMDPPDECQLKELLASKERHVIHMQANTYVRWRSVPPNFFLKYYKPRRELLDSLPYDPSHPPSTVVHLRKEDGHSDYRKGLDEVSLDALGQLLSTETEYPFLVTNNVEWYELFQNKFGWRHPKWAYVKHSVLRRTWGTPEPTRADEQTLKPAEEKQVQRMQLWADWYTIVTAKKVYHTHSDFSLSAIHWMGMDPVTNQDLTWSRTILEYDHKTKQLQFTPEQWMLDPVMKRLVDREGDELAHCGTWTKQPGDTDDHWAQLKPPPKQTPSLVDMSINNNGADASNKERKERVRRKALEFESQRKNSPHLQKKSPDVHNNNPSALKQVLQFDSSSAKPESSEQQNNKRQELHGESPNPLPHNPLSLSGVDMSNKDNRQFLQRALEIEPGRMEALERRRQTYQNQHASQQQSIGNNPMTPAEISASVTQKLKKKQEEVAQAKHV
ncbi:expressed unknown protein [Seminavis robusta]|uniref:Uncharacterized protein n=1 Tax=Seminavis robusta TaxID=568900 RepID=A0A9N8E9F0_9STRA|nr:expressed unknown protein [Seminavis robusta]|eukprot:Sro694_g188430.1 n/a (710) ;mRNA; f:5790-8029